MSWRGPGPRPVLSYGVGVHGLGRDSAPSHLLATGLEGELAFLELALSRGWSVVVTDGEGLGLPGPHTYGAGRVGGRAMLDIVRAAVAGVDGVEAGAPVLLWGYSEGGRCADGGPYSGLGLAVLVGLAHAHEDPRLWDILNARGRAAAAVAATLDVTGLVVSHPEPMAAWTTRERPWEDPLWAALLRAERNPGGTPEVPVYLYHAKGDDIVPAELSRQLAAAYEAMGVHVTHVELDSGDHLTGAVDGADAAITWLAEQLDAHLDLHRDRSAEPDTADELMVRSTA